MLGVVFVFVVPKPPKELFEPNPVEAFGSDCLTGPAETVGCQGRHDDSIASKENDLPPVVLLLPKPPKPDVVLFWPKPLPPKPPVFPKDMTAMSDSTSIEGRF